MSPIILGSPTLLPLETAEYSVSIAPLGSGTGMNVAGTAGSLAVQPGDTTIKLMGVNDELVHAQPNGVFSYSFDVTAPDALVGSTFDLLAAVLAWGVPDEGELWDTTSWEITIVPEPGTLLLIGGGLVGLALVGRRRSA